MGNSEKEIQAMLEDGVSKGNIERDNQGRYRMTESGKQALAVYTLLEIFDQSHDLAFTFGALVTETEFEPEMIASGLIQLINDKVIHYGVVDEGAERYIFHLCDHQKQLRVFADEDDSPDDEDKYLEFVETVLQNLSSDVGH